MISACRLPIRLSIVYLCLALAPNLAAAVKKITLKNGQSTAITVTSIVTSLSDYTQTNTCASTLSAGKSCTISVTFTPSTLGSRIGTLIVTDSGTSNPQTVGLRPILVQGKP